MNIRFLRFFLVLALILVFFTIAPLRAEISQSFLYPEASKKISMDFQDANLKDVLKIFSQQAGMNFIASEAVQERRITLFLDNVPVEEALEQILTANNLIYEIQEGSNIFIVRETGKPTIELVTKVFFLKHASVANSRISQEILNSIVSSSTSTGSTSSSGTSSSSFGGSTGGSTQTSTSPGSTSFGIREALLKVISENGKITEDPRTNSLTITDVPKQFLIIEQTIARLDIPLPQVMIEVEMLDVSKDTADKLGMKFSGEFAKFTGGTHTTGFPFSPDAIAKRGLTPTYTLGTLNLQGLTATLEFLTTKTDTKYLARPKLLTLSNQTAEIRITTQEAIGIKTSTTGETGLTTQTAEAERAETGVSLRVTPQVNPETGEITMFIEPKVSQAKTGGTFRTTTGQDTTFKDPEERGTKSIVRIRDGETIMVGGLIRTDYSQVITKIPLLGDIPLLGGLFRHKNTSKNEERELIVFITPRIVKEVAELKSASLSLLDREQGLPPAKRAIIEETLTEVERKRR